MLLSSLIISNCEDRVLFLLIHLTGVVSMSILSLKLFFLAVFLVPCPTECFHFVHLHGILSFNLFNLSRFFGFTHWSKKQLGFTSPLPLLFPPVPS